MLNNSGYVDAHLPDWEAQQGAMASSMTSLEKLCETIAWDNSGACCKAHQGAPLNVDTLVPNGTQVCFPQWYAHLLCHTRRALE